MKKIILGILLVVIGIIPLTLLAMYVNADDELAIFFWSIPSIFIAMALVGTGVCLIDNQIEKMMKKRIVKALNAKHEVVYVIQIKRWWCSWWRLYKKYVDGSSIPIEFATMEAAESAMSQFNEIEEIL